MPKLTNSPIEPNSINLPKSFDKKTYLLDKNNRKQILLDTNFLLTLIRYKIHGFEELKSEFPCDFFTLTRVMFELERLSKDDKKIKKEVILVKAILKNNNVRMIDSTTENVDDELVEKAKEGYIIATNDKALRERIKKAGGKTLFVRSLTYIETADIE